MKNTIIMLILTAALSLTACGGGGNGGAKDIATKFAIAYVVEADPTAMMEYCDEAAQAKVQEDFFNIKESSPEVYEAILKAIKEMQFKATINKKETKISGTESKVVFDLESGAMAGNIERMQVDVRKSTDGVWQVYNWKLGGLQ